MSLKTETCWVQFDSSLLTAVVQFCPLAAQPRHYNKALFLAYWKDWHRHASFEQTSFIDNILEIITK